MGWAHAVPTATHALGSLNPKVVFQATRLVTALALMSQRLQVRETVYCVCMDAWMDGWMCASCNASY